MLILVTSASAADLLVPWQYPTIQAAIDATVDGDTVIIAASSGTYTGPGNRDINFLGKAITVRSESGPETCAVNCNCTNSGENHSGFIFENGEDGNSILQGFTITDCFVDGGEGGGIRCRGGRTGNVTPTILDCIITANSSGIYCERSNPEITDCIITDNNSAHCFSGGIYCTESNPKITGCTISNNKGMPSTTPTCTSGGGISCYKSSPTITECSITNNSTQYYGDGGGIWCYDSSPAITACDITDNSGYNGGGIYCEDSNLVINDCNISGNSALEGDGIYFIKSNPNITNCAITNNDTGIQSTDSNSTIVNCTIKNNGTGISCNEGNVKITDSTLAGNSPFGALYISKTICTITRCNIMGNSAYSGGGISCPGSSLVISNSKISGNFAQTYGGAISCTHVGDLILNNCTVTDNTAENGGGGLHFINSSSVITNCILSDNFAAIGPEFFLETLSPYFPSSLTAWYSNVKGGQAACYDPCDAIEWNIGNIYGDPCFVEPGYWADINDPNIIVEPNDPNAIWIDGDYHLLPISPCINAGDPNYIPKPNETDLDGNPRIIDGRIDMGAYETVFHKARLWIKPRALSRKHHKFKWIIAWMYLPDEVSKDQIDTDTPLTLYPGGIEAQYQYVFENHGQSNKRTRVLAFFNSRQFLDAVDTNGLVKLKTIGFLKEPGQYFTGSDFIIIVNPHKK